MKTFSRLIFALFTLLVMTISNNSRADDLLKIADVEAATGLKGLKLVPKDPMKGAGGTLNFADADGKLVLLVMIEPMSALRTWKQRYTNCEATVSLGSDGCVANVDKTFGFMMGFAYFSKNNKAIWLQQMGNKAGDVKKPNVDKATITKLAQLAYDRS